MIEALRFVENFNYASNDMVKMYYTTDGDEFSIELINHELDFSFMVYNSVNEELYKDEEDDSFTVTELLQRLFENKIKGIANSILMLQFNQESC